MLQYVAICVLVCNVWPGGQRETFAATLFCSQDLLKRLQMARGKKSAQVGIDDIERAIKKMSVLGNGFRLVQVGCSGFENAVLVSRCFATTTCVCSWVAGS
jgi:hypothetical protein